MSFDSRKAKRLAQPGFSPTGTLGADPYRFG
jgi:hypothetical protein